MKCENNCFNKCFKVFKDNAPDYLSSAGSILKANARCPVDYGTFKYIPKPEGVPRAQNSKGYVDIGISLKRRLQDKHNDRNVGECSLLWISM